MLTVASLFSGIGGFDLGLERTGGFRTVWFCEQDEFCRAVLKRHWPDVPCFPDITKLHHPRPRVDVLCGGFPCQDISSAGLGAGIDGKRSGLWSEYARLIRELQPRYVIVENVSALLARGLGRVLGDLAAIGYDAEWDCIPASAVGAPHRRDRLWLVAYPQGPGREARIGNGVRALPRPGSGSAARSGGAGDVADAHEERRDGWTGELRAVRGTEPADRRGGHLQDIDSGSLQPWRVGGRAAQAGGSEWWSVEPPVGRVAHGVPDRLDQLAALGNALVPQIAEWIGRCILDYEAQEGRLAA